MKKLLRRHRRWSISPYKAKWHKNLNQIQALETLKLHPNPRTLLSALADSFAAHGCDPTADAYAFVADSLFRTSHLDAVAPLLLRLESRETFHTPEPFLARVIRSYGLAGRFGDAVGVFSRIPRFRCVPSCLALDSLLCVLCGRDEGLRFVPDVLVKSKSMGIRLEESSFRILVSALCRIGGVGYAVDILKCMVSDGYGLDEKVCSSILSALCDRKDELGLDGLGVLGFLEGLKRLGFCPSLIDYTKVVGVLVKERRGLEALKVLGKIKGCGIKPDIVCYTIVLNGIVVEGEYEKADKLFDELLVLGLVPNVHTYNAYIKGLCRRNDVEGGLNMISSMEELGCKPNATTYNLALKALCKNGEIGRAKELVSEMGFKGVGTNLQTRRILLQGVFGKGDIVEACVLMEEMLEEGLCRHCLTYDEIIFGLCRRGMVCKALEMLEKMVGKNVAPGERAWESLLLGFGSELSLPEAVLTGILNPEETSLDQHNDIVTSMVTR